MIVFISSVRRGLEEERDYLPGLLTASGHEPRRFEDFSALPVPSRDACLAGVEAADVYLLLLGPHYGNPLPDTGQAPTEEEFTVAKRLGMPILAFRKSGANMDARQQDFISRVGDYQQGRFWKEFSDNGELAVAVLGALREVAATGSPLRWEPLEAEPAVRWRADRPALADSVAAYIPVLEIHLATVTGYAVLPVNALEPLADGLVRAGRDAGLFSESASVARGSNTDTAWARNSGDPVRRGWNQIKRDGPTGLAVDRDGSVLAFKPLVRDDLGSLVNQQYLATELKSLLRLAHEMLPADISEVAPVAGLGPITQVMEGDPRDVGHRVGGGMRMSTSGPVRTQADAKVVTAAMPAAIPEIAQEVAARILAELRTRR